MSVSRGERSSRARLEARQLVQLRNTRASGIDAICAGPRRAQGVVETTRLAHVRPKLFLRWGVHWRTIERVEHRVVSNSLRVELR